MFAEMMKRYMPRGIYGRAALILLVPIVTILVIGSVIFVQRHYEYVTRQMTGNLVLELALVMERFDAEPDMASGLAAARELATPLDIEIVEADEIPDADWRRWYDFAAPEFFSIMRRDVPGVINLVFGRRFLLVDFWVETPKGVLQFTVPQSRVGASNPHQFLFLMTLVAIIMICISFVFLRNQMRPIMALAHASDAFGRGQITPYTPSGATEVRSAGLAFLEMRSRLERQIEQRTLMLSGVSHDLRTPLTRMKLALSMMPDDDEERRALERDVIEMERLLDVFLDFSRDDASEEGVRLSASQILSDLGERYRGDRRVTVAAIYNLPELTMRPMAVQRALGNLVENALRYGHRARVSARATDRHVRFIVEDDGPGIAPEDRERATQPFVRLDASRNQDKGSGVGLGLSIASDVARRHGGSLFLGVSDEMGGLRAELVLPLGRAKVVEAAE